MIADCLESVLIGQPIDGNLPAIGSYVRVAATGNGADVFDLWADPFLGSNTVHCDAILAGEAELNNTKTSVNWGAMHTIQIIPVGVTSIASIVHGCT